MRCIRMLKIYDAYTDTFQSCQCRNPCFGTHDFCLSCLKVKVWRSQSRVCAVRACDREIENEVDARLLYPQKEYGKGVYDRMHVVCESCYRRYVREAKKRMVMSPMYWITPERSTEIEAEVLDWYNLTLFNTGRTPGKHEVMQKRFNIYRRERRKFRKSPDFYPLDSKDARCEDCRCETQRDRLAVANPAKYGEADMLCWVCRENRLWALGLHPGIRDGGGLLKRMKKFFSRIDLYRKVVPVTLDEECDLMEAINYLTPKVSSSDPRYQHQRRVRKRLFVIDWWYSYECPSCREVKEDSQWVVDWERDLAGCKSCHTAGWSQSFKRYIVPFGLAVTE